MPSELRQVLMAALNIFTRKLLSQKIGGGEQEPRNPGGMELVTFASRQGEGF